VEDSLAWQLLYRPDEGVEILNGGQTTTDDA
jgi:hypothetical protein